MDETARADVIVGVDTHKHVHAAVAIDALGARLGATTIPVGERGYQALEAWARSLGPVRAFGVEGAGSYGAGLSRFLVAQGHAVLEVNRPDRHCKPQNLFELTYCAGARTGIGLSSASKPERTPTKARRAAETSSRPARSRARPPQCDSQPKLRSTTQRRASTTKPSACGSRETTRWRLPWTFDHSRQRSAANAPS